MDTILKNCAHLLHDVGFSDITITPASNDFGVDILAKYNGVLYAFQCKRYSSNVGVHAVHEITGGNKEKRNDDSS